MELKATLEKPYTDKERADFIVYYNYSCGYEIKETSQALQAWAYTEEEYIEIEAERIQGLYMTRSDFFDGTIKAFGADSDDLLAAIQIVLANIEISDLEKKVAISNYKNALNFYRKHPLFTLLADVPIPVSQNTTIIITSNQWDQFFDLTDKKDPNAYKALLPPITNPEE